MMGCILGGFSIFLLDGWLTFVSQCKKIGVSVYASFHAIIIRAFIFVAKKFM